MQLCASPQEARSAHVPYHRAVEAPAGPVCQGHQKANQDMRPKCQRGQGSQHIYQGQNQRNNQRMQP
eukprot:12095284-Ditylum_brightwellii.AAC.1